jgi:membrane-associated phospholipid phosphatase
LINLALFLFSLIFFITKKALKINIIELLTKFRNQINYIIIILGVVILHLVEVNYIDPQITEFIGNDFASNIQSIEGDIVFWFSQHWTPILVYFFVIIYIAVYPFTLWFSPLYFIINNEKKAMKNLSYGLLLIYLISLPFYLFFPITNVYRYYGVSSALENVIPSVENFFYSTTTQNNCLPSLHTAMTILVAWSVYQTRNKKLIYFSFFCMISVIISVIYLSIHWIADVISGAVLSVLVILILKKFIIKEENNV